MVPRIAARSAHKPPETLDAGSQSGSIPTDTPALAGEGDEVVMPAVITSAMLEFTAQPRQPNGRLNRQIQLTDALDGLTVDQSDSQY